MRNVGTWDFPAISDGGGERQPALGADVHVSADAPATKKQSRRSGYNSFKTVYLESG